MNRMQPASRDVRNPSFNESEVFSSMEWLRNRSTGPSYAPLSESALRERAIQMLTGVALYREMQNERVERSGALRSTIDDDRREAELAAQRRVEEERITAQAEQVRFMPNAIAMAVREGHPALHALSSMRAIGSSFGPATSCSTENERAAGRTNAMALPRSNAFASRRVTDALARA